LQVARELCHEPRFYYPHTTDFRGRAYPLHPYLHHMGDDLSRGLLTFAEAKPLGKHGLDWLLVHVSKGHARTLTGLAVGVCELRQA
jgi:DNA-directed RNA polymerase